MEARLRATAAELLEEADTLGRLAERKERAEAASTDEYSHKRRVNATVNVMHEEHRLAISKSAKDDKFTKALRAAKFTQGSLAAAIGVRASMLSMYRTKDRKIPLSRARRIEELTGWPADAKHWPCGIILDA